MQRLIQEFATAAPVTAAPPKGLDELTARGHEVFQLVAAAPRTRRSRPS